jgi:hypothetical protein
VAAHIRPIIGTKLIGKAHSARPGGGKRRPLASPLHPGSSIGHIQSFPGTLGCVVRGTKSREDWIGVTSASHVLSVTNTAEKGDPIIAPGHPDGPKNTGARCGSLARYTYLTHYNKALPNSTNYLCCPDIALVKIDEAYETGELSDRTWVIEPETKQQMPIIGTLEGDALFDHIGEKVYKVGRTTDLTEGVIDTVHLQRQTIELPDERLYLYTDVITVERTGPKAFSEPGDSGAIVYTREGYAIGFVIGGTDEISFISPISECMREIEAEIML